MDIDVDFEYSERQRVIDDYICKKYGQENVSQITTFITLAARAILKDVGKVLGISFAETNRIAKLVPKDPKITLEKALEMNPELKEISESSKEYKEWFAYAKSLEGLPKATSLHAAGVVIYPEAAINCMPQAKGENLLACQYNMVQLEELGYLKMDFLGLRTLTVEKDAIKFIKQNYGIDINIDKIDLNDKNVLDFIGTGKTTGVFQLESGGMQNFMKELKPQSFEDIIAGVSLYRPGPMDYIPEYIKGKNGDVVYDCPQLEPILSSTYGTIVYQEQVMQIFRALAGYSMGQSDNIRRAMSKKKQYVIDEEREYFVNGNAEKNIKGCVANGISSEIANRIYDKMVNFAKYAFNKSHAAAYSVIAMQTAWLKYYYPIEYYAALLTSVISKPEKLTEYMFSAKKEGIIILPPDINKSGAFFTPENGKIRFGLAGIKGVGTEVAKRISGKQTDYKLFGETVKALQKLGINSKALKGLILAGAFDCMGGKRSQYETVSDNVLASSSKERRNNIDGQMSFFDVFENIKDDVTLPDIPEYTKKKLLSGEKEVTGVYISGHPLDEYVGILDKVISNTASDFLEEESTLKENDNVIVAGIIKESKIFYTKKDSKPMAILKLEDISGEIKVIVFPKSYDEYKDLLLTDHVVAVLGHVGDIDEGAEVKAVVIESIEDAVKTITLEFPDERAMRSKETFIKDVKSRKRLSGMHDIVMKYNGKEYIYPKCFNLWEIPTE